MPRIELFRFTCLNYFMFSFLIKFRIDDSAQFRISTMFGMARSLRDLLSANPNTANLLKRYRKMVVVSVVFAAVGAAAFALPFANEFAKWTVAKLYYEISRVALSIKPGTTTFGIIQGVGALPLHGFLEWSSTPVVGLFLVTTGLIFTALGILLNYDCYIMFRQMIEIYNRSTISVFLSHRPSSPLRSLPPF